MNLNYFFKHPSNVCMTYFEHCMFLKIKLYVRSWSFKAIIHALFPDYYITSTSDLVKTINYEIENTGCNKKLNFFFILYKII